LTAPLEGVLVVSLEQAVAAPVATCRLADAGARVIKVERPEGDFARGYDRAAAGTASYFAWANRGKQSIALDLKVEADRALIQRMIARADVFVQNLALGAAARLGLGAPALRAADPRLICCDITGYGATGPQAADKAYDLLVQAESGLLSVSGAPGGFGRIGVSVADIATGMNAALVISQALIRQARTGEGAYLALSLFAAMADWMTVPLLNHEAGASPGQPGLAHPSIAPYGAYACAEGGLLLIAVQSDREWRVLAGLIGRPELADDPRFASNSARVENRAEIDAAVAAWFAGQPREAASAALRGARIAVGALNDLDGLARHPHLARIDQPVPGGRARLPAPPVAADWQEIRPVPALDEHGAAIRAEFAA